MGRITDQEYTYLSDREIAGTSIGTSPAGVAAFSDLQRAVYEDQPQDTKEALDTATQADGKAVAAQDTADSAQASADDAGARADAAQTSANDAYDLAGTKVTKDVGPTFAAPTASPSRVTLPAYAGGTAGATYTQADMQAAMDQIAALTSRVAALIVDLRANHSLTN